jgi:hypothetical protein
MDRARRLRLIGIAVLACGVVVGAVFYWVQIRSLGPAIDDTAAGYTRAQEHQMKVLMGPLAMAMSRWADFFMRPDVEALLIVAFAGFVTYMCFRHAAMPDD